MQKLLNKIDDETQREEIHNLVRQLAPSGRMSAIKAESILGQVLESIQALSDAIERDEAELPRAGERDAIQQTAREQELEGQLRCSQELAQHLNELLEHTQRIKGQGRVLQNVQSLLGGTPVPDAGVSPNVPESSGDGEDMDVEDVEEDASVAPNQSRARRPGIRLRGQRARMRRTAIQPKRTDAREPAPASDVMSTLEAKLKKNDLDHLNDEEKIILQRYSHLYERIEMEKFPRYKQQLKQRQSSLPRDAVQTLQTYWMSLSETILLSIEYKCSRDK